MFGATFFFHHDRNIFLLSSTSSEYVDWIFSRIGKGRQHAKKIYSDWIRKGVIDLAIEKQSMALVKQIASLTDFSIPELSRVTDTEKTAYKFLLSFSDGLESESVVIPMQSGTTLCISSQVGCRMGCAFCETGKMGLLRHLKEEEIVAQVFYAKTVLSNPVNNIVFMGMGEPFDNFSAVKKAVAILCDPLGFGFGPSRITISTSGDIEKIQRFAEEFDPAVNLAVSVNASNDETRSRIMPINRKWNMAALKETLVDYCKHPRRSIFAEYVLIKGINDSLENARELAAYLKDLRVKVNVIPYNPQSKDRFAAPEESQINAFISSLREQGYQVLLRQNKGRNIMAACGQLGNKQQRLAMLEKGSIPIL